LIVIKSNQLPKISLDLFGIISLCITGVMLLLILNWFFKITPFQKLQGMPLLLTPFTCTAGFLLGLISYSKSRSSISKWGMLSNVVLFVLPFLYWFLGALLFKP
jgi:hypothetical protein